MRIPKSTSRSRASLIAVVLIAANTVLFNNCSNPGFEVRAVLQNASSDQDFTENVPASPVDTMPGTLPETVPGPGTLAGPDVPAHGTPVPPPAVQPSAWPNWRKGMAPFQWKRIPNTSLTTVRPTVSYEGAVDADGKGIAGGLYGRALAWNGFAANPITSRVYSAGNGGHADYAGNEAYEIDFSKEQPKWILLREPTEAKYIRASNGTLGRFFNYYLDGRPSSTHTYYALQFLPSKNAVFKFGAGSIYGTGNESNDHTDAFSLTKNDWVSAGTYPDITPQAGGSIGQAICRNTVTDEVYIAAKDRIRRFDPKTNSYSIVGEYIQNASAVGGGACVVDHVRNKVVYFRDAYKAPNGGLIYDIATMKLSEITFTGSATNSVTNWGQAYAWYDEKSQAYFLKPCAGDKVVKVNPDTYSTAFLATTGGEAMHSAVNGVQTRFQILPALKGYVHYPDDEDGFWFLATE